MNVHAVMRFVFLGNRSLEGGVVLLARVSLGVFFAIPEQTSFCLVKSTT
jgi:hypothetical protein